MGGDKAAKPPWGYAALGGSGQRLRVEISDPWLAESDPNSNVSSVTEEVERRERMQSYRTKGIITQIQLCTYCTSGTVLGAEDEMGVRHALYPRGLTDCERDEETQSSNTGHRLKGRQESINSVHKKAQGGLSTRNRFLAFFIPCGWLYQTGQSIREH